MVPVERSGIWDAHRGLDALVRAASIFRLNLDSSTPKILGILIREFAQGGLKYELVRH